jgi:hypothetical protein
MRYTIESSWVHAPLRPRALERGHLSSRLLLGYLEFPTALYPA